MASQAAFGMRIHILGSGTSTGVPVISCTCPICQSDDPRNKRLRSSIAIEIDRRYILIDCSIDFRQQMLRTLLPRIDAVLVTHTHSDHINGIDELRIFNYRQRAPIPVYSSKYFLNDLKTRFYYCFNPLQKGGGVPDLELRPIEMGTPFEPVDGIEILPVPIRHGKLSILGYRVGDFAYLTDCSAIPKESESMLQGLDTLILSALRYRPHPTHFNLEQALEAAQRLKARKVFFTHIADEMDHETTNRELPDWANLLFDGQVIEIPMQETVHKP